MKRLEPKSSSHEACKVIMRAPASVTVRPQSLIKEIKNIKGDANTKVEKQFKEIENQYEEARWSLLHEFQERLSAINENEKLAMKQLVQNIRFAKSSDDSVDIAHRLFKTLGIN